MSLFAETVTKAISDYRFLLRRYLSQVERVMKLQQLKLKDPNTYNSDFALYKTAYAIVADIDVNMEVPNQGYYSYSGIQQFCQYLKEYLDNYLVEGEEVVHRAQKASRALIQAIQLTGLSRERLTDAVNQEFIICNEQVVTFGTFEQCELYLQTLSRQQMQNPGFYTGIIAHLESMMSTKFPEQSAA